MLESDAGIFGVELPVGFGVIGIAVPAASSPPGPLAASCT